MNDRIKSILKLTMVPTFIGAILYAITTREEFFEVPLVLFGLFLLIVVVRRSVKQDKKNMEKYGKLKGNPNSDETLQHKYSQANLLMGAFLNFLISYLVFLLIGG